MYIDQTTCRLKAKGHKDPLEGGRANPRGALLSGDNARLVFQIACAGPAVLATFIDGPADGALDTEDSSELVSILARNTTQHLCNFRLPEIPFIGTDQVLLFEGLLEETPKFFAGFQFGPEYWWPNDHQWCVCSDYDLTFTIVGGSSQLITALLKSDVLECIEISPAIRVDDSAPMPPTTRV